MSPKILAEAAATGTAAATEIAAATTRQIDEESLTQMTSRNATFADASGSSNTVQTGNPAVLPTSSRLPRDSEASIVENSLHETSSHGITEDGSVDTKLIEEDDFESNTDIQQAATGMSRKRKIAQVMTETVPMEDYNENHTEVVNNLGTLTQPIFYNSNAFHKQGPLVLEESKFKDPVYLHEADAQRERVYEDPACVADESHGSAACTTTTATFSSSVADAIAPEKKKRGVQFQNVCIREYAITIGDNPYCSFGAPICLDWSYSDEEIFSIDFFETSCKQNRSARRMLLSSVQRRDMLWRSGYTLEDIERAIKLNDKEKLRRSLTLYFLPLLRIQEMFYFSVDNLFQRNSGEITEADIRRVEQLVQKQQHLERERFQRYLQTTDTETGRRSFTQHRGEHELPQRRLSFRSSSSQGPLVPTGGRGFDNEWSLRSSSSRIDLSQDRDDPYAASHNSRFKKYSLRVDRSQHDKATEIVLCSMKRPHMRAFHAAWLTFFTAFFMWFAITPLLGEVKETLNLSNADVWYSSLCGTAATIIMRILMGPACDIFGARICMAFILAVAAIPCALTGLVQTSQGLSVVRTFIGVAGSSFVACQYWTSQMFTREVAGTANALVAGWGNLGGGITQLVMGSALFPLFKIFFGYYDSDSSEQAWRTVFVVPAGFSLLVAYITVYHCDDSPKGDYRERVRQQEIAVVSPIASLCAAAQNWNVWILLIHYACCFGVEVTMTNATALYFKDEYGQSTVSAAAIASVFGIMNLFARGIGGFASDFFNRNYGMHGRVAWQAITIFLEGVGIIIFGYAESLATSIVALIFLSLMVQSAEGSTFGIVPYVDRRYTGSVVGWVGAGGNVGGVCFSVLFIHFHYRKSFFLMGVMASCSSVLSCFLNCKKLSKNASTLALGRKM